MRYLLLAEGSSGDPLYGKTMRGVLRYRREDVAAILDSTRAGETEDEVPIVGSVEEALKKAPATSFRAFCDDYLARNRPVQQFPADANVGIMLSNNIRVVVSPRLPGEFAGYGGSMQHSGDIKISTGESQPGLDGVVQEGGIKII